MCDHRGQQICCLAAFFTYQFAMVYIWLLFIVTSNNIAELIYCPQKVTGRTLEVDQVHHHLQILSKLQERSHTKSQRRGRLKKIQLS